MRSLIIASVLSLFVLAAAGCSTQPGGSDDPVGFKSALTPPGEAAPQAEAKAPQAVGALQEEVAALAERMDRLEQSHEALRQSIASIGDTAQQALDKAAEDPLSGVDISDDQQVGQALMKQSLEQIIGISRLLLDKMQSRVESMEPPSAQPQAAPETQPQ